MIVIVVAVILVAGMVAVIGICNGLVKGYARDKTFDTIDAIPHRTVGLLLGTAPITPQGPITTTSTIVSRLRPGCSRRARLTIFW